MAESITHFAVCDDSMRLALNAPDVSATLKQVMVKQKNFARMGCISRGADSFVPPTIEALRARWGKDAETAERDAQKLGYVLGGMCHRAGDRISKPIYVAASGGKDQAIYIEASIYHEAVSFREVYAGGYNEPFVPWIVDAPKSKAQAQAEQLIRAMFQQALISFHTFSPKIANFEDWLDRMLDGYQELYMSIPQYAQIFTNPDPAKVKQYVTDPNFYDPKDPAIQLAREIQAGDSVSATDFARRAVANESSSAYARGIVKGLEYLRVASGFWEGQYDLDEMKKRLEVGVPDGGVHGMTL